LSGLRVGKVGPEAQIKERHSSGEKEGGPENARYEEERSRFTPCTGVARGLKRAPGMPESPGKSP